MSSSGGARRSRASKDDIATVRASRLAALAPQHDEIGDWYAESNRSQPALGGRFACCRYELAGHDNWFQNAVVALFGQPWIVLGQEQDVEIALGTGAQRFHHVVEGKALLPHLRRDV